MGRSLARRTMRPASATLVVAGDLDPEVVFTMAAEVFGTWVAGQGTGLPALPPAPWPAPAERTTVIYDQGGDTDGWATLLLRASGEPPGTLAEQATLAKLLESRLERALVLGEFKVNVDRASVPGLHMLGVRVKGRSDRLAPALKRALDELGSLKVTIDDPLAMSTARWNVARDWAFAFNRISQTAARYAELASAGLPSDGYERFGEQVAGVTPGRLREVMSRYSIGKEGIRIGGPFDRLAPQLRELGLDPVRVPEEKEEPKD
jgi:predicted Zn-dependent peptidase